MRFLSLIAVAAVAAAAAVLPSQPKLNTTALAENTDCPKASRYACGQYMLEDGTRQDFVSQVYNCVPRNQFICNTFKYAPFNPTNPGQPGAMIAAKVDPGCTCTFYTDPCDGNQYHEDWAGWEGEPGQPPWSRPAYTDKHFKGWWCYESY